MSTPPGATVTVGVKPAARSTPTDTGPAHIAILTDRAPSTARKLESIDDWPGSRQTYSVSYDWADTFFREGGNQLNVAAVVGPSAAAASANVPGTSGTGIVLTARDKGEWANGATGGLSWRVFTGDGGGTTRQLVVYLNGTEVARTADYTANQTAVDAFAGEDLFTATIGGGSGLTPVTGSAANFTGGSIDRLNITTAHLSNALALHGSERGPGQEAAPDFQSDTAHAAVRSSAMNHNRFAVLDTIDTTVKSTLIDSANYLRGGTGSDSCALYGPWITVPSLAAGGSDRAVPASALVCAKMAVNDAVPADGPAQSPAFDWGVAQYATGVRASFSRDTVAAVNDAGDLNEAGVNLVIEDNGAVVIAGFRTLVDPDGAQQIWGQVGSVRHRMSLVARGIALGKRYVGRKLTSRSVEGFENDLNGMLLTDFLNGDLFGDLDDNRPQTAFRVDTDTPNTPTNIQAGRLGAVVYYRPVKGAEFVQVAFEAVAITDTVG